MSRTHCKIICSLQTALEFYDELEEMFWDEDLEDIDFDVGCATSHSKDVERDSFLVVKFLMSEYESAGERILDNEPRHIWDMNSPIKTIRRAKDRLADHTANGRPIVLARNLPKQSFFGNEFPYWAGASDDEKTMALVPRLGLGARADGAVLPRMPEATYRNVRDHKLSFTKKLTTPKALAAISQPCQGDGCGTAHALLTHTARANAGGPEEVLDILPMDMYFELVHNLKMAMASPREERREALLNACFIGDYAMSLNTAARLIRKHRVEIAEHMTEARLEKELRRLFGKESEKDPADHWESECELGFEVEDESESESES